jgi:hypothetical protein
VLFFAPPGKKHTSPALWAQGLFLGCKAANGYLPNLAPTCISLELIPASADTHPPSAFTPTPYGLSQHFPSEFLHDPQSCQLHPDVTPTMATATTTIIELTFMDNLAFFTCASPKTISGQAPK